MSANVECSCLPLDRLGLVRIYSISFEMNVLVIDLVDLVPASIQLLTHKFFHDLESKT